MTVRVDSVGHFKAITLENDRIKAILVPDLGGKMISLASCDHSLEFLLQPPEPDRGYRKAAYGNSFEEFDTSGFDECIPTVSECNYPKPNGAKAETITLPDHGEVWSISWEFDISGEKVDLKVHGTRLPYSFCKRISLEGADLIVEYEMTNEGTSAFDYLWSAHPLLEVNAGDKILLPPEIDELFVNWSAGDRLGKFGDSCPWPKARTRDGFWDDLSVIKNKSHRTADKLYTGKLNSGFCGYYREQENMSLAFRFATGEVPYAGLWICQGGWPTSRAAKHYTVAVEPCSGRPDALDKAIERNSGQRIMPGETKHWTLRMEIREGIANP